jgi:Xaa-Pro aminopeptidase
MTTEATTVTTEGHAARTQRLIDKLDGAGVDLLLVTELIGVRYLTGFTGSSGLAVVGPDTRTFVTDFRYTEQAADEVDSSYGRITASQTLGLAIPDLLPDGPLKLGFDEANTAVQGLRMLRELLDERIELVPTSGLIEELRRVKEPQEIELIAAAQRIADEAFEALIAGGLAGKTERELALTLEFEMRRRGASSASFESIIAAGPHGALPHAQPRDVTVKSGDLVVIDWGAYCAGYCSDCTRTVAVGSVSDKEREVYELVLRAQLAGLDAVRAGADSNAVDKLVRDIIGAAGYREQFGHGLGHGVGLEIHEAPTLSYRIAPGAETLMVGEVVTVEPGVYLPGEFGVRIEDLTVVTAAGPTILTSIPKDLAIVD